MNPYDYDAANHVANRKVFAKSNRPNPIPQKVVEELRRTRGCGRSHAIWACGCLTDWQLRELPDPECNRVAETSAALLDRGLECFMFFHHRDREDP
eukprot:2551618-Amphidinium_carterae.1